MARHTGCFITRFVVRPNDMTAIRRLSDREYGGSIADICERVLYQKQGWIESETPAERSRCITREMLEWSVRTKGCQSCSDRFVAEHTNERRDRKERPLMEEATEAVTQGVGTPGVDGPSASVQVSQPPQHTISITTATSDPIRSEF